LRVVLTKEDGDVTRIRTFVGGRWREGSTALDLGTVPAGEAAEYFVTLAEHSHGRISRDAIRPATMADSAMVWPALLRIARDDSRSRETKRAAARWVGIAAGDVVMEQTGATPVEDPERGAREQAVFALSRLPRDQAVPELLEVARTHRDPQVRKRALFWLGETGDHRALDLFEELLRR
jgi:HEAT repeat protein